MFGFKMFVGTQPQHKGIVLEFAVCNAISSWFRAKGWGAVTLPFFGIAFILYWLAPGEEVNSLIRVHEWVHIEQAERPGAFYVQYFRAMYSGKGYRTNALEEEAYAREAQAARDGLPDWA